MFVKSSIGQRHWPTTNVLGRWDLRSPFSKDVRHRPLRQSTNRYAGDVERLESRLREMELLRRGSEVAPEIATQTPLDEEDIEDLEDAPQKTRTTPPRNRFSIRQLQPEQ